MSEIGGLFSGAVKRLARKTTASLHNSFNDVASVVLDNGLRAQIKDNINTELLSVSVAINSGSGADPSDKPGLAHFLEHMIFCQNEDINERIRPEIEARGGHFNGYTNDGNTVYEVSLPDSRSNRKFIHQALSQMIFSPEFDPQQVEEEKNVVLNEIQMHADRNERIFAQKIVNVAFGKSGSDILGTEESVKSITVDDLRAFHHANYMASNAKLSISGPSSFRSVYSMLQKNYGDLSHREAPKAQEVKIAENPDYIGGAEFIAKDDQQTQVGAAFSLPTSSDDTQRAAASVLATYINQSVIDKFRGQQDRKAYSCGAGMNFHNGQGILTIFGSMMPESSPSFFPAIAEIVNDISTGNIDQKLFKASVALTKTALMQGKEATENNAAVFQNREDIKAGHLKQIDALGTVKQEDLASLVNEKLLTRPATMMAIGDVSQLQSYEEFKSMLNEPQQLPEKKAGLLSRMGLLS